jgi:excisionase family DNA binding protein
MDKIFCNVREAAAAVGVGRSTMYELMKAGAIKTAKIGQRRLVCVQSLTAYADTLREAA